MSGGLPDGVVSLKAHARGVTTSTLVSSEQIGNAIISRAGRVSLTPKHLRGSHGRRCWSVLRSDGVHLHELILGRHTRHLQAADPGAMPLLVPKK